MNCYLNTLLRRLSTLHPQMAIKKSSAFLLLRQKLRSSLPFLCKASSSLLISSISTSANLSNRSSFSNVVKILLLFIVFATKLDVSANISKLFRKCQEKPGFDNIYSFSRTQLKEIAAEKGLLVVPISHINTFILNVKNEFYFHGPVGQFIENANNINIYE